MMQQSSAFPPAQPLSGASDALWKQALAAVARGQMEYARLLLRSLLQSVPAFVPARRLLRQLTRAQRQAQPPATGVRDWPRQARLAYYLAKARLALRRRPLRALEWTERALGVEPHHPRANLLLAQAAQRLGLWETAALAYETLRESRPTDKKALLLLAQTYMQLQYGDHAVQAYEQILRLDAYDGEALSGLKNAAALHAFQRDGWNTAKDFRELARQTEA